METKPKCSFCDESLIEEEADNPRDGEPVCDECYHEHFEFTCCWCEEYGDEADQHNMLVVFEPVDSMGGPDREVKPGVYQIKQEDRAYHGGPIIGEGWLYGDQLERIADVPADLIQDDEDEYPCGHLCLGCQKKVAAEFR